MYLSSITVVEIKQKDKYRVERKCQPSICNMLMEISMKRDSQWAHNHESDYLDGAIASLAPPMTNLVSGRERLT